MNIHRSKTDLRIAIPVFMMITMLSTLTARAQDDGRVIRIARITIHADMQDAYQTLLKEQIDAAIASEPGVLILYAVRDKKDATSITVFEIYASQAAYQSHIQTSHFRKYKSATASMVKSLELSDVSPIALGSK